jgi:hypothetical protein
MHAAVQPRYRLFQQRPERLPYAPVKVNNSSRRFDQIPYTEIPTTSAHVDLLSDQKVFKLINLLYFMSHAPIKTEPGFVIGM